MPLTMTITGTRSTGHRESTWYTGVFTHYVRPFAEDDASRFYVGGAKGIDSLALSWLARNTGAEITVVVPGTVAQQPPEARRTVDECRERIARVVELGAPELRTAAYHARNRWMVDRSDMVIGFPAEGRPKGGSGTWQTIDYGAHRGKPRLIVPV
ncbi:hypothetical protein [Streptomyces sp. NPDC046939]|uniref:hypothetical protein n=1 Tax=Streptomyces sp. NPDC046939 TaxID=3155376 RepID=UPI0033CD9A8C